MPSDAPTIKLENTRADGATVVPYNRADANRAAIADDLVEKIGATLVPPYDDPFVIAGQGTVGQEFAQQAAAIEIALDAFLAPCSGGGLIAGCALALSAANPATKIYSVEPTGFDDTAQSLTAGVRTQIDPSAPSICDALLLEIPGALTFPINKELLTGGLVVSDADAQRAMAVLFQEFKIVAEPSGATALAAVLDGRIDTRGKSIGVVVSGGNVDPAAFLRHIEAAISV
jgi:threonine dehydratase